MELEYKKCVFCLGSTSNLNIHDIGLTKLIYHPTCIYRYKCALSLIYILIIILDLLVYTSLDLPDYFNTFIIFGISYIFTGILAYVVSANSTNILHYAIGAIPTVVNHVILLVTSLISKYNSSVISPKIVTYIFLGFSWSIVVCVILVGILWGFMFIGAAVSAVVAYLSIAWFLKLLNKISMMPFVWYRLVLGIVLIGVFAGQA